MRIHAWHREGACTYLPVRSLEPPYGRLRTQSKQKHILLMSLRKHITRTNTECGNLKTTRSVAIRTLPGTLQGRSFHGTTSLTAWSRRSNHKNIYSIFFSSLTSSLSFSPKKMLSPKVAVTLSRSPNATSCASSFSFLRCCCLRASSS